MHILDYLEGEEQMYFKDMEISGQAPNPLLVNLEWVRVGLKNACMCMVELIYWFGGI